MLGSSEYDKILACMPLDWCRSQGTNGHFIHAGPLEGIGVSIYLSRSQGSSFGERNLFSSGFQGIRLYHPVEGYILCFLQSWISFTLLIRLVILICYSHIPLAIGPWHRSARMWKLTVSTLVRVLVEKLRIFLQLRSSWLWQWVEFGCVNQAWGGNYLYKHQQGSTSLETGSELLKYSKNQYFRFAFVSYAFGWL
jgi:hypothetical protein